MTTNNGFAHQAPLYVRALRLRHLHVGGFVSFLLFECMIAAGVLLALAELVSWWAVPVLPAVVAIMVKVNDMVIGGSRRARAQARSGDRGSSDRASATRVDPDAQTDERPSAARRTAAAFDRVEDERPPAARRTAAAFDRVEDERPPAARRTAAAFDRVEDERPPAARRTATALDRAEDERPPVARRTATALDRAEIARAGGTTKSKTAGSDTTTGVRTRTVEPPAQRKKVGVIRISVPARDGGAGGGSRRAAEGDYGISPGSDVPVAEPVVAAEAPSAPVADGAAAGDAWTDTDAHGYQRSRPMWADRPAQDPWGSQAEAAHAAEPGAQGDRSGETGGWGEGDRATGGWDDRTSGASESAAGWSAERGDGAAAGWPGGHGDGAGAGWSGGHGNGAAAANWGDETAWGDRAAWADQRPVAPAQQGADWDDDTGWADQAAWGSSRSPYGGQSSWGAYAGWEGAAADYSGEEGGSRSAFGSAGREQAARDLTARGEAYRAAESGTGGYGPAANGGYGSAEDGGYGPAGSGDYGPGDEGSFGEGDEAGLSRGASGGEHRRDGDERVAGGRHARQQPAGRRRSEETSGHFTTGRHAERSWRTDDELARQRTGGLNQGRFA
ncbi:hypothetical protein [Dactylosporangium sp. CA-092794]|uniref:hypothetical protein n=1 Tax=Dactylosporangium sp. CA-092794 TaxID=3239929 RepID=UPI003D8EA5A6